MNWLMDEFERAKARSALLPNYAKPVIVNDDKELAEMIDRRKARLAENVLPIHRTEAGWPRCSTCDGGGCYDCTDPA